MIFGQQHFVNKYSLMHAYGSKKRFAPVNIDKQLKKPHIYSRKGLDKRPWNEYNMCIVSQKQEFLCIEVNNHE